MIDGPGNRGPMVPATPAPTDAPHTICKNCGCTPDDACLVDGVPCGWSNPFLCTRCASRKGSKK